MEAGILFFAALLDDVEGLDLDGLVGVAVVGGGQQAVFAPDPCDQPLVAKR